MQKTLLKTTTSVISFQRSGREYVYLGIENQLKQILLSNIYQEANLCDTLELSLNIDGIPLHKSSSSSLWPILCCVCLKPVEVFPVAVLRPDKTE